MTHFGGRRTAAGTRARSVRFMLLSGCALALASRAGAQDLPPPADASAMAPAPVDRAGDIVVTASRIATNGFAAPTPTTVIGTAQLQAVAPTQVVDVLALIPSFRTTTQPASATAYPDLRGLGPQRTLVLVNGRRHVSTYSDGTVDLGVIPAILVQRAEVVTGGASASWGSGAVAGVVNLILKNDLQGIQGSAQAGVSSRGDDANQLVSLAAGTAFAGGRGHVLIGGEYSRTEGIRSLQQPYRSRPWSGRGSVGNAAFATNRQPGTIFTDDARRADVSEGGLITSGPLRGITFEPNGQFRQFGYGAVYGNNMIGGTDNAGDAPTPGGDLKYPFERYNALARVSYEFSDALKLYAEGSYAHVLSTAGTFPARNNGSVTGNPTCTTTVLASGLGSILVPITNPYLPTAVRTQAQQAGVTCFNLGRVFREEGLGEQRTKDGSPSVYRGVVGADGNLFGDFKWSAYYQYGRNHFQARRGGNLILANFNRAIDAVVSPTTGQIVCRVNGDAITTNDDPACAPFNLFGRGSASAASIAYVSGETPFKSINQQQVAAIGLTGDLFSTWAGPVGVAFGGEWRKESIKSTADPIAQANGYQTGNRKNLAGSYSAREAYAELAVPLAKDWFLAESFDLNLAARLTDYSSSGRTTTWKVGATWDIVSDLRIRASKSRDIRAGNLNELFSPSAVGATNVRDPRDSSVTPVPVTTIGNPQLKPEKATTFTAGMVFTPSFLSGFRASVDYYDIDIKGQIGTISANQVAERCFLDKLPEFCAQVTTNATGAISGVTVNFQNLDRFKARGLDLEASYRMPVSRISSGLEGDLLVRVLGTYLDRLATTVAASATTVDPAGQYTNPHWTVFGFVNYQLKRFTATADLRWYEGGTIDNTRVEGAIAANGVNINRAKSTFYTNLTFTTDLSRNANGAVEAYFRVANLFDKAPPFPATGEGASLFDTVGRAFRVGFRFKV